MTSTIQAKPYAKAVFEYARDHEIIPLWFDFLSVFSSFYVSDKLFELLTVPGLTDTQRGEIMLDLFHSVHFKLTDEMRAFVFELASNKRLSILPDIFELFITLKENFENTMVAEVLVFEEPSDAQKDKLISRLSKRFKRQVFVNITEDKSLLGGMIIKINDNIIDGSVRRSLEKLASSLMA